MLAMAGRDASRKWRIGRKTRLGALAPLRGFWHGGGRPGQIAPLKQP
jgi:hypothetical protein